MRLFDNKTIHLIINYLLDATVNSYENVTCKENIFLIYKFRIFNLKVQGPFQNLLLKMGDDLAGHLQDKKSQDISRISRTSGHHDYYIISGLVYIVQNKNGFKICVLFTDGNSIHQ